MKRKSILLTTALIALAILAGCSESVVYPTIPSAVSIRQTGDFVAGQDFDASKFEVKVTYLSGASEVLENAALELWGSAADGVTAGDQVYVNVGKNIDGYDVEYTANISRIYSVTSAKATTEEASFAIDATTGTATNVDPGLFTVTVYGSNGEPIVLGPSNYTVRIEADTAAAGYAAAETVEADAVIEFSGNIKTANTGLSNIRIPVTATKTATIPSDDITSISFKNSSCAFKFAAFDYEGNLPEIDPAQLSFDLTYSDGNSDSAVKGSDIEGLELSYVDVTTGDPITEKINSTDFVSMAAAGGNSTIAIEATVNGVTTASNYTVPVKITAVVLEYLGGEGEGIVTGTPVDEVVLDPSDFRAYVTLDGKYAETITLTADMLSVALPATGNVGAVGSNVAVAATYMGLSGNANVPVIAREYVTDVEYSDLTVTLVKGFSIAKQHYNSSIEDLLDSAVASVTATKTTKGETVADDVVEEDVDVSDLVELSYTKTEASTGAGTAYDGDGLDTTKLTALYVQAKLDYGAEDVLYKTASVTIVDPEVASVVIEPTYTANPAINAEVKWNVKVNTADGWIFDGEYKSTFATDLGLTDATVKYYVDGATDSALPATIEKEAQQNIVLKINEVQSAQGVNLPAGRGYVTVDLKTLTAKQVADQTQYIGETISTANNYYELVVAAGGTMTGVTTVGEVPDSYLPVIDHVEAAQVEGWTLTGTPANDTVYVYVRYTGIDGVKVEKLENAVQVTSTPWVGLPEGQSVVTLSIGGHALSSTGTTTIPEGTYNADQFVTNLKANGAESITYTANATGGTLSISGGTLTIGNFASGTITINYRAKGETTASAHETFSIAGGPKAE